MKIVFFYVIGIFCLLASCQDDDSSASIYVKERKDIVLSRAEEQWANESKAFAFICFQQVNGTETEHSNWMISPFSASAALGMMANGAKENTLEEIKNTLGFSNFDINGLNEYYRKLTTELLELDNTAQLNFANAIWIKEGLPIYDSFVNVNRKMYDAEVRNLDFSSQEAPNIINDWCADKTNGNITEVYSSSPSGTLVSLMNALYFKGVWKYQFKKSNTKEEVFTNADGSSVKVPMMNQEQYFNYTCNDDFHIAEFPYGNAAFSMVVFLPAEGRELEDVIDKLTYENWENWYAQRSHGKLKIKLPRFEVDYRKNLTEDMKTLGLNDAFDGSHADFSALSSNELFFNTMEQFTCIKVNEEGTEASAITKIEGDTSNGLSSKSFHVVRPFAFLIKEQSTGTILFMGKVTKL